MTAKDHIKRIVLVNLAFWAAAILAPIVIRLVPTSSGAPPKFFEMGVPIVQGMLALGTTQLIRSALAAGKEP